MNSLITSYLSHADMLKVPFLLDYNTLCELKAKEKFINENFPNEIIDLMGGNSKMMDYPILSFNENFLGWTDYLDRIKPSDVSYPIMIGVDCFRRAFVTIRTSDINGEQTVDTLFQRYSDDKYTWTHGVLGTGVIQTSGYFFSGGNMNCQKTTETISNLLSGKNFYFRRYPDRIEEVYAVLC